MRGISVVFFLIFFFPDFSYFLLIQNFYKKMQNDVVLMGLTAATNKVVTEPYIDQN